MSLTIKKIVKPGVIADERVIFNVTDDTDVGFFGVFKTIQTGESTVSNKIRNTYWFPDKSVKKGDLVVLYSKVGVNTERRETDGSTVHFFYWGNKDSQWTIKETNLDAVVLFKIEEWSHKPIKE